MTILKWYQVRNTQSIKIPHTIIAASLSKSHLGPYTPTPVCTVLSILIDLYDWQAYVYNYDFDN